MSKSKPEGPTDKEIDNWVAAMAMPTGSSKLEHLPEAADLLKKMLVSVKKQGRPVNWAAIARHVRKLHPLAPRGRKAYKRYAEDHLGW